MLKGDVDTFATMFLTTNLGDCGISFGEEETAEECGAEVTPDMIEAAEFSRKKTECLDARCLEMSYQRQDSTGVFPRYQTISPTL